MARRPQSAAEALTHVPIATVPALRSDGLPEAETVMSDEERNVTLLKQAYKSWKDTQGGSVDEWMNICSDNIKFGSLAQAPAGAHYLTAYDTRHALKEYFNGIERDWEMIDYVAEDFVAQGDRVVMLGHCSWRNKKTGKMYETKKAASWRFANGKAIEYFEFYDTAGIVAAMA
jgi:ketosteroid isomerase-like protein